MSKGKVFHLNNQREKSAKKLRPKWLVKELIEKAEAKRQMRREKRLYQVARGGMAMNDDRCVSCGDYVPEGRMVCARCEMAAAESVDATIPFMDTDETPAVSFYPYGKCPWYVRLASKVIDKWLAAQGKKLA